MTDHPRTDDPSTDHPMTDQPTTDHPSAESVALWHSMSVTDAETMMTWLRAIGFVEHATYRDPSDCTTVVHAEWLWPHGGGGGLMFGSEREDGAVHNTGRSAAYLITADPDATFEAAVAAGATVEQPVTDQDYGGRGGTVSDPEGNHWSFGDYQPGA